MTMRRKESFVQCRLDSESKRLLVEIARRHQSTTSAFLREIIIAVISTAPAHRQLYLSRNSVKKLIWILERLSCFIDEDKRMENQTRQAITDLIRVLRETLAPAIDNCPYATPHSDGDERGDLPAHL